MTIPIYCKRLKRLIQDEYEINKLEYEISQKCITLYEMIQSLKSMIKKHYQELLLNKKEVSKWRYNNSKLANFIKKQIDNNLEIRKRVNELQVQYNDRSEKLVPYREEKLKYMCSLHILKQITNMYTNKKTDALHSIKCIVTYEGEDYTEWMLVRCSLIRYTLCEITDALWRYIEGDLSRKIT